MEKLAELDMTERAHFTSLHFYKSAKTRPGADCGSDHELLIAKFRLKLKNIGKTIRPFHMTLIKSFVII